MGEHEQLSTISLMATAIAKYGPAFAGWAHTVGVIEASEIGFRSTYLGSCTLGAFGRDFADDLGLQRFLDSVPDKLATVCKG